MLFKMLSIIFSVFSFVVANAQEASDNDIHINFDITKAFEEFPITLSITGYVVVFLALVLLIIIVTSLTKILSMKVRKRLKKENKECAEIDDLNISGDVNAAIAMALHLHFDEIHDDEDTVLTILMQKKSYKPWSSKLYSMTPQPVKQIRNR